MRGLRRRAGARGTQAVPSSSPAIAQCESPVAGGSRAVGVHPTCYHTHNSFPNHCITYTCLRTMLHHDNNNDNNINNNIINNNNETVA
eukprot:2165752-Amphidinium_carterae.1